MEFVRKRRWSVIATVSQKILEATNEGYFSWRNGVIAYWRSIKGRRQAKVCLFVFFEIVAGFDCLSFLALVITFFTNVAGIGNVPYNG